MNNKYLVCGAGGFIGGHHLLIEPALELESQD